MKKIFRMIIAVNLTVFCLASSVQAAAVLPVVEAEAACLMMVGTKQVLYDKNKDGIMYPASTTKIVTLLTALENGRLGDEVLVSADAAACEGSSLDLRRGDRLALGELLYGMMLVSGNDAAVAVAEHVGRGSTEDFVQMMNKTAEKAGAARTHFTNPHGLPDPINHYTTANDMALITSYGYGKAGFAEVVATREHGVIFNNRSKRSVMNTNRLLGRFPDANGVKTGYTNEAGECLVAGAKRGGVQLVAVIFNSSQRWNDAGKLLEYGFQRLGVK